MQTAQKTIRRVTSGLVMLSVLGSSFTAAVEAAGPQGLPDGPLHLVRPYLALQTQEAPSSAPASASTGRLIAGGILGGAGGFLAGGAAALVPADSDCEDEGDDVGLCRAIWVFAGGSAVGAVGVPLGVHLANGRKGNLALSVLASVGIGALGIVGALSFEDSDAASLAILGALPVAQLASSIVIERRTGRSRASRRGQ